ncbi:Hypothetical predicted protein [Mytilus galloprovincialis]|uniref:Uncharacterized protein n=1 Tax=Mytilus galloprovincialis TaxID=29158 RepID=A0A8B6E1W2_MYTGA|nr:Hypothetical predicted protein [Mytilus galloprovincialis]
MEFNAPSPYKAITGLDGSLPFPVTATTEGQGTPPNSSQLTNVFTSVTSKTGQQSLNAGSVGYHGGVPTITTVAHTFSRQVDTTGSISSYPGTSMGLNLPGSRAPASYCGFTLPASASNAMSWSRPPWSQGYPFSGFHGQGFLISRLGTLENIDNKSNSPVISLCPDYDIGSDPEDSDEEERLSVVPGSQEEGFTSDEKDDNSVQVSQNVSQPSVPVSISSVIYQFQ